MERVNPHRTICQFLQLIAPDAAELMSACVSWDGLTVIGSRTSPAGLTVAEAHTSVGKTSDLPGTSRTEALGL